MNAIYRKALEQLNKRIAACINGAEQSKQGVNDDIGREVSIAYWNMEQAKAAYTFEKIVRRATQGGAK
jgi:hypothetical protein